MYFENFETLLLLGVAALVAGAVNSVAGGGTLLTFPAILGVLPPGPASGPLANGTNKFALVPGAIAGAVGYSRELHESRRLVMWLLPPSLVGGVLGTLLVTELSPVIFARLIPWLILIATLLMIVQQPIARWARERAARNAVEGVERSDRRGLIAAVCVQFVIAVYGGYFGAGIGILLLTALGFMGLRDIHHTNAVKNLLASLVNTISAITFVINGQIRWDFAVVMAIGSVIGGYAGARSARRLPAKTMRRGVIGIGLVLAGYYFVKQFA